MKALQTAFVSFAFLFGIAGCCAYRGINQASLVHVRNVRVTDGMSAGTNSVAEVSTNGVRVLAGRVIVVSENVYVSIGGGSAASNDVSGELSLPLVK
jgi:hypothetical protein